MCSSVSVSLSVPAQVLTDRQTALTMPFKLHKSPFKLEISQRQRGTAAQCVRDSSALQTQLIQSSHLRLGSQLLPSPDPRARSSQGSSFPYSSCPALPCTRLSLHLSLTLSSSLSLALFLFSICNSFAQHTRQRTHYQAQVQISVFVSRLLSFAQAPLRTPRRRLVCSALAHCSTYRHTSCGWECGPPSFCFIPTK